MEVEALLADSAVSAEGKLYLQGAGWNILNAPSLPIRIPRIGLGIVLSVPWTETNRPHQFEVRLLDADGRILPLADAPPGVEVEDGKIRRLGASVNVGRPPSVPAGDEQLVPIAMNIDGLVFTEEGRFEFIVAVDDRDMKRLPIRVVHTGDSGPIVS
jgi:uncharacterized protein DUF6941